MCVKYVKLFWYVKKIFLKFFDHNFPLVQWCIYTLVLFENCAKFALTIANAGSTMSRTRSVNPLIALVIILLFIHIDK